MIKTPVSWRFSGFSGNWALFDADGALVQYLGPPSCESQERDEIARALNALPVARQMREALESLQAATSGIYPNTEAWAEITNARTALAAAKGAGI